MHIKHTRRMKMVTYQFRNCTRTVVSEFAEYDNVFSLLDCRHSFAHNVVQFFFALFFQKLFGDFYLFSCASAKSWWIR